VLGQPRTITNKKMNQMFVQENVSICQGDVHENVSMFQCFNVAMLFVQCFKLLSKSTGNAQTV